MKKLSKTIALATTVFAVVTLAACSSGQTVAEACDELPYSIMTANETLENATQNIDTMNEDREAFLSELKEITSTIENNEVKDQLTVIAENIETIGEIGNAKTDPKDALKAFEQLDDAKEQLTYATDDLVALCNV